MDAQSLIAKFRDFCHPHKVLTRAEADEAQKLTEIGKSFLWQKAKALVATANGAPILYSYGSDGTPVLTKCTLVAKLTSGKRSPERLGKQQSS